MFAHRWILILSKVVKVFMRLSTLAILLLCVSFIVGVERAHALIEIRGTYGMSAAKPSEISSVSSYFPALTDMRGLGADLIVSLPLFPIGFGVRYEKLDTSKSTTIDSYTTALSAELSRIALLVNFRIIDTGIYLGALGTYGLSHTTNFSIDSNIPNLNLPNMKATSVSTMTVGVEGGIHLMGLVLGGDLGYMMGKASTFTSDGSVVTINGSNIDLDLGGLFAKIHVGYTF